MDYQTLTDSISVFRMAAMAEHESCVVSYGVVIIIPSIAHTKVTRLNNY